MAESKEAVALELLRMVAFAEGKDILGKGRPGSTPPDRAWLLTAYQQCLAVASNATAEFALSPRH